MKRYTLIFNGKSYGPLTRMQIAMLHKAGKVPSSAKVAELVERMTPQAGPASDPAEEARPVASGHVTIERTSKSLKIHQVYAWAVFVLGVLIAWGSVGASGSSGGAGGAAGFGSFLVFVSFVYGISTRVAIWWHHG